MLASRSVPLIEDTAHKRSVQGTHVASCVNPNVNQLALEFLQARKPLASSQQVWQYTLGRVEEYWEAGEVMSCNALHVSSMFGLDDLAMELLPKYDIDTATSIGTTALMKAASWGFPDLVRLFMSRKADPTRQNWYGTALHAACEAGQIGTIQALLDAGVDVNIRDQYGRLPLTCAALSGYTDAMRILLEGGADANLADYAGAKPLFLVMQDGARPDIVQTLLTYNADLDGVTKDGNAAIHIAALNEDDDGKIAGVLLDHGAKIGALNSRGHTVVHLAAARGHTKQLAFFLDRGVAADVQDKYGATALYLASNWGQAESVKLLLAKGARTELEDMDGLTPLCIAQRKRRTEIIQLLLDAGANVDALTRSGVMAKDFVQRNISRRCDIFVWPHGKSYAERIDKLRWAHKNRKTEIGQGR
ncbi:MAG: hypothetical protein Q9208_003514 [Pyrenodesmia sp. 3 TL-2023]